MGRELLGAISLNKGNHLEIVLENASQNVSNSMRATCRFGGFRQRHASKAGKRPIFAIGDGCGGRIICAARRRKPRLKCLGRPVGDDGGSGSKLTAASLLSLAVPRGAHLCGRRLRKSHAGERADAGQRLRAACVCGGCVDAAAAAYCPRPLDIRSTCYFAIYSAYIALTVFATNTKASITIYRQQAKTKIPF